MPNVMTPQQRFAQIPAAQIPRSTFDRSHAHKTTFDAGLLIPVYVDEALPGDTFSMNMSAFARLTTPLKPLMDNLYMDTHFFAVPVRLVWNNWQKFNGEQIDPGDSTSFVVPTFTAHLPVEGSLSDYMGIPVDAPALGLQGNITYTSLWHRAYNLIWNEWYRDQNMQDSVVVDKDDGPDSISDYVLKRRGKRHDYFTSSLPWTQKGTAVSLPLGTTASVIVNPAQPYPQFKETGGASGQRIRIGAKTGGTDPFDIEGDVFSGANPTAGNIFQWSNFDAAATGLYTDLSTATAATINQLRQAFQIQKLLERDARGGTRYTEILKAHFGVTSPDARLQRPEYLGGGTSRVVISPVAQNSSTDTETPQGNLAAIGTLSFSGHGFTKSFTEHCLLIGLVSVRADLTYQQGINRMFKRSTRYDFYWPALAHIGEQAVLKQEIFMTGNATDTEVFGYQERYAEYRYKPSLITGAFRSQLDNGFDIWHLSQEFSSIPTLDDTFITEVPPIARVVAVVDEPHFYFDSWFQLRCARPMPVYGVPGFVDHF